jgi:hypothetical protein
MLFALGFFSFGGSKYIDTAQATSAGPCHIIEHYYYDDVYFTNLVGYRIYPCTGGVHSWGIVTQYEEIEDGGCCGSCCD